MSSKGKGKKGLENPSKLNNAEKVVNCSLITSLKAGDVSPHAAVGIKGKF